MKLFLGIFLISLCLTAAGVSSQEFSYWVDEKGVIHITNNHQSIPEKYRGKVQKQRIPPPTSNSHGASLQTHPSKAQASLSTQRILVPFVRQGNGIVVRGTVNGKEEDTVEFIVEPGATLTFIPRVLALKVGIDPAKGDPLPMSIKGSGIIVPLVEIDSLKVGKAEVKNMAVAIHDVDGRGLLGIDFLSNFRIDIDNSQNQIVLEPQNGSDS